MEAADETTARGDGDGSIVRVALLVMLNVVITTIIGFEKTVDVEPAKAATTEAAN